jgi:acetylornithine deacetylase/succinyl-diaminopimelate desuccinylase-like protein
LRGELERFRAAQREEGFELELALHHPREGHKLSPEHPLAQLGLAVLREDLGIDACFAYSPAGNDAVFFGNAGIAAINKVGPGDPAQAHRVDEFVREDKVLAGTLFYIQLALRYFAREVREAHDNR